MIICRVFISFCFIAWPFANQIGNPFPANSSNKNISILFDEINSIIDPENTVILFDEIDVIALNRIDSRCSWNG